MTEKERQDYLIAFGNRVKSYRLELGMTQGELAVKMGYVDGKNPSANVSKIEKGQMELTQSKILDLAKALQVEPYELFTDAQTSRLIRYATEISKMKGGD